MLISEKCMCENNYEADFMYTPCTCTMALTEVEKENTGNSLLENIFMKMFKKNTRKYIMKQNPTCKCIQVAINKENKIEILNKHEPTVDYYEEIVQKIKFIEKTTKSFLMKVNSEQMNITSSNNMVCYGKEVRQNKIIYSIIGSQKDLPVVYKIIIEKESTKIENTGICPLIFIKHCTVIKTIKEFKLELESYEVKNVEITQTRKANYTKIISMFRRTLDVKTEKSLIYTATLTGSVYIGLLFFAIHFIINHTS